MKTSIEVTAADAAIDALWRRSWIGAGIDALVLRLQAAWIDSTCRRLLHRSGL